MVLNISPDPDSNYYKFSIYDNGFKTDGLLINKREMGKLFYQIFNLLTAYEIQEAIKEGHENEIIYGL